MMHLIRRIASAITVFPRRLRSAINIVRQTSQYLRYDRPELNAALRAVGLPRDETPVRIVLWHTVRALPATVLTLERQFAEALRSNNEVEPFLRVARSDAPEAYDWQGPATVEIAGRSLTGDLASRWDGSRISGTLEHRDLPPAGPIRFPSSIGRLRGEEARGTARFSSGLIEGIEGEFLSLGNSTSFFTAQRIVLNEGTGDAKLHRYCFRGGRLRGWSESTERITRITSKPFHKETRKDSFDLSFLKRRCRITQVRDDEGNQRGQVIGVTIGGEPLDERAERLLWLVLSFVVGNRVQPISAEHFDANAVRVATELRGAVEYGEQTTQPPFDLRITEPTFAPPDFDLLAEGFAVLEEDEDFPIPIAQALHHLHDANTGYTQVEMKNLLFCIHTLFEAWATKYGQREIIKKNEHKRLRNFLSSELDRVFGVNTEIRAAVQAAVRNANERVGALLQEAFFDSLGVVLSERDLRALRRRNALFHNGYLTPKPDQSQLSFLQELFDDANTLRTLAHIAILKLAGYDGSAFDYRTYSTIIVASGYPDTSLR